MTRKKPIDPPADTEVDLDSLADEAAEEEPASADTATQDNAADETPEKAAGKEEIAEPGLKKLNRKEILERLLEKNEMIMELTREKNALERNLKVTNDKWLRTAADFENYRKRSRKEWDLLKQQTKADVILEILNVVDDFERAFSVAEESESAEFIEGFRLIYTNLVQTLAKMGVEEIDAHNAPFDPNFHMAVAQLEAEGVEAGHVVEVVQKGYHLDDTVIRPANVVVAK